jgi:hypothetical protein
LIRTESRQLEADDPASVSSDGGASRHGPNAKQTAVV